MTIFFRRSLGLRFFGMLIGSSYSCKQHSSLIGEGGFLENDNSQNTLLCYLPMMDESKRCPILLAI